VANGNVTSFPGVGEQTASAFHAREQHAAAEFRPKQSRTTLGTTRRQCKQPEAVLGIPCSL
jgi:hypothetical protein